MSFGSARPHAGLRRDSSNVAAAETDALIGREFLNALPFSAAVFVYAGEGEEAGELEALKVAEQ